MLWAEKTEKGRNYQIQELGKRTFYNTLVQNSHNWLTDYFHAFMDFGIHKLACIFPRLKPGWSFGEHSCHSYRFFSSDTYDQEPSASSPADNSGWSDDLPWDRNFYSGTYPKLHCKWYKWKRWYINDRKRLEKWLPFHYRNFNQWINYVGDPDSLCDFLLLLEEIVPQREKQQWWVFVQGNWERNVVRKQVRYCLSQICFWNSKEQVQIFNGRRVS